jgi:ectoine hydroxylase-related dioxygenase (phytanoyl-CoA dioxygenase family)
VNLEKGQVSFHHCLTIHGSGPNRGTAPRRSIAVHLQDEANRWQEFRFKQGRLATHANDQLVRQINGAPDYTDPDFCPVLYRDEAR